MILHKPNSYVALYTLCMRYYISGHTHERVHVLLHCLVGQPLHKRWSFSTVKVHAHENSAVVYESKFSTFV